ncbi:tetratricopeptide repeat protein [Marinicella litoralis]|nr:tetratricopeptide repeat protein [Marinicella litoralis]
MKTIESNRVWLTLLLLVFSLYISAQETKQTVALSPEIGNQLLKLQKLVEQQQYAEAQTGLSKLQQKKNLSAYENAQIWNLTAYTYYLEENYSSALKSYEKVLDSGDIPLALQQSTLNVMSQLYFTTEKYDLALATVKRLIEIVPDPSADTLVLLGQAYYQGGRYAEAITPIKQGVEKQQGFGKTPKENWLLLLRSCYYETNNYQGMLGVLKDLVKLYPKDDYIVSLAGVYSELGDFKKQMVLTEVMYEKGLLKNTSHIENLANLYLMHDLPYKAAVLLETEMADNNIEASGKRLELIAQAWFLARDDDKAIPALEKAASMTSDGELYLRLAQSYMNVEEWEKAAANIENALNKGVKRPDSAQLMLGNTYINQKKYNAAKSAFESAAQDNRSSNAANQWLRYVNNELQRRESLEQEIELKEIKENELLKNSSQG